ncbi:hypothetical protein X739_04010 [Mesorhizobium sp. LNHC220B00]|nr:hypothetical protein X739_04010 [Mesorhizobium sp. LNHC220B00]
MLLSVLPGLLRLGVLGFFLSGLCDGLASHGAQALLARAGLGLSVALIMTGFNALAIKDYDKPTSNWLLSYLNMATSSYGLIMAALAARIATTNANAVYALFGVPAVILPFFMLVRKGAKQKATPSAQVQILTEAKRGLRAIPLLAIVAGHMAVRILLYFELAHVSMRLLGFPSGSGQGTAIYVLGHVMGAVGFRPARARIGNPENTWQLR